MSERDDYADNDLPPPRKWPSLEIILGWASTIFVVALVILFVLYQYLMQFAR